MLTLLPGGRMLVAVEPVDGRKGIDSLAGVVRSVLPGDPAVPKHHRLTVGDTSSDLQSGRRTWI
jgi:hypothetical protein